MTVLRRWQVFPACTARDDSIYPFAIVVYEGVVHGTCGVFQIFVFRSFLQLE
jgi:hypothetical protein